MAIYIPDLGQGHSEIRPVTVDQLLEEYNNRSPRDFRRSIILKLNFSKKVLPRLDKDETDIKAKLENFQRFAEAVLASKI